jgi:hypothetical protein
MQNQTAHWKRRRVHTAVEGRSEGKIESVIMAAQEQALQTGRHATIILQTKKGGQMQTVNKLIRQWKEQIITAC